MRVEVLERALRAIQRQLEQAVQRGLVDRHRPAALVRAELVHPSEMLARCVDVPGEHLDLPEHDVGVVERLVDLVTEPQPFLRVRARRGPLADAQLELGERTERMRQRREQSLPPGQRHPALQLAAGRRVVLHPACTLAQPRRRPRRQLREHPAEAATARRTAEHRIPDGSLADQDERPPERVLGGGQRRLARSRRERDRGPSGLHRGIDLPVDGLGEHHAGHQVRRPLWVGRLDPSYRVGEQPGGFDRTSAPEQRVPAQHRDVGPERRWNLGGQDLLGPGEHIGRAAGAGEVARLLEAQPQSGVGIRLQGRGSSPRLRRRVHRPTRPCAAGCARHRKRTFGVDAVGGRRAVPRGPLRV